MDDNQSGVTPPSSDATPPATTDENKGTDNGSTAQVDDKQVEAYRQQQSRADKASGEADGLKEQVDYLTQIAMKSQRDEAVSDFLKENADKYPNVSSEDLVAFATGPDDLESVAKHLETKALKIKQDVLASVREVPQESMTEDEMKAAKAKLENSNDPNRFAKFLRLQSMQIRK